MVRRTVTVELASGLEARPVAMLVQVASQYESNIYVEIESKRVNAKSIMGMMTLGLAAGEHITITADGTDEEQAITDIEKYLSNHE
ncbi:HPr family phosphocarrier protein [Clostridium sp. Marseille-P2415]|uniref:HPr family phosphocarrier protein n=1 Tax=Clostridium sp. Marseille-P2415 TaxID=1805471 RepID=UPI00098867FF|nr:HPr family phosphocarrier protein [Clostridium sp. Marseille-P2415]